MNLQSLEIFSAAILNNRKMIYYLYDLCDLKFIISDVNSSYADFIDLPEETFSIFVKVNIAEKIA